MALFRAGDDRAFGVIHDRYRARLLAYARQMLGGSRQDAEDALQDVFLRAYAALRASDRPVSLRAWLYRVAHNRCIDQLRRPVPTPAAVFEVSRTPPPDTPGETERREDLRRLVEDVRRLPEQQRSALLMRELEGLSYAELATALGVTVPAVKSLLVRARIGLVEAGEARDAACVEVRGAIDDAHERGVRASALARRHVRDCAGCRAHRDELRGTRRVAGLVPLPGPLTGLLQLLGLGGAGSGAAAGVAGGGAGAAAGVAGGAGAGVAAVSATKVAAIVSGAALTVGGAVEVGSRMTEARSAAPPPARSAPPAPSAVLVAERPFPGAARLRAVPAAAAPAAAPAAPALREEERAGAAGAEEEAISPHAEAAQPVERTPLEEHAAAVGGAAAPEEPAAPAATPAPAVPERAEDPPPAAQAEPAPPAAAPAPPAAAEGTGGVVAGAPEPQAAGAGVTPAAASPPASAAPAQPRG